MEEEIVVLAWDSIHQSERIEMLGDFNDDSYDLDSCLDDNFLEIYE